MHLKRRQIQDLHHLRRLNLINGITGIKPANLIGSYSEKFGPNLSIFSSIVHLGSDPALIGFILRPSRNVSRNTFENILETGYYTINHVHESFTENAHYTSAKFEHGISEFKMCGLSEEYKGEFIAPYVKESKLQIGMKFLEALPVKYNETQLVIGQIEEIYVPDEAIDDKGYVRLDRIYDVGIGGLNNYYSLKRIASYPYARKSDLPDFSK